MNPIHLPGTGRSLLFLGALIICQQLFAPDLEAGTRTVTSLADSGPGSLREAISASVGGDLINFAVAGTIVLTSGELGVGRDLTILGPTAGVTVSGNNQSRVFNVVGGTVVISNLVISGGLSAGAPGVIGVLSPGTAGGEGQGGGIRNSSFLTLINCTLSSNTAAGGAGGESFASSGGSGGSGFGGAIYNRNTLTLIQCTFVGNSATGGQGGPNSGDAGNGGAGGSGVGGAIYNTNALMLVQCTFSGNSASAGNGGNGLNGGSGGDARGGTLGLLSNSTTTPRNNIIAGGSISPGVGGLSGNPGGHGPNGAAVGPDVDGVVASQGHNLVGKVDGSSGWTAGDFTGSAAAPLNPLLGPLRDNGGGTLTMALQPASGAIDAGDDTVLGAPYNLAVDQRGHPRKLGAHVDIGACESGSATLLVQNNNDSGPGSLRQCLAQASVTDGDTVGFASNVTGMITLTGGEIAIDKVVNIAGPGANALSISGNSLSRVFILLSGSASISGLTICDGRALGSSGNTEQNGFQGRGGGIFNQATLTLANCIISNNTVIGGQGGPTGANVAGNGAEGLGGGIYSLGNLSLQSCLIASNTAVGGHGGNADSGFAGSAGNGSGGGVCMVVASLVVTQTTFVGNTALGGQGGASTGNLNDGSGGQGYGGSLYTEASTTLANSALVNSRAGAGTGGGGMGSGSGGGLFNNGSLALYACTVANNTATGSGFDFGGGVYDQGVSLLLRSCTISSNSAGLGGGLCNNSPSDVGDTILADNSAGVSGPDCSGAIYSSDFNLVYSASGITAFTGVTNHSLFGVHPRLGPLRNNGGATPTMTLLPGSPAIDQGKNFGALSDQRGRPRVFNFVSTAPPGGGDDSDIGAFELIPPTLAISQAGNSALLSWPIADEGYILQTKDSVSASVLWTNVPGTPAVVAGRFTVTNTMVPSRIYRLRNL